MLKRENMVSALQRWTLEGDQPTEIYIYTKYILNTPNICYRRGRRNRFIWMGSGLHSRLVWQR